MERVQGSKNEFLNTAYQAGHEEQVVRFRDILFRIEKISESSKSEIASMQKNTDVDDFSIYFRETQFRALQALHEIYVGPQMDWREVSDRLVIKTEEELEFMREVASKIESSNYSGISSQVGCIHTIQKLGVAIGYKTIINDMVAVLARAQKWLEGLEYSEAVFTRVLRSGLRVKLPSSEQDLILTSNF
jgi:hypothetical protein